MTVPRSDGSVLIDGMMTSGAFDLVHMKLRNVYDYLYYS